MIEKERTKLQNEIIKGLPKFPIGRLILAPRVGKTRIAIELIKKSKPNSILWVTPSATLANKYIPKEFEKWKAKKYLSKLQTITWASLHKIKGKFDMIILDEEQFITENNATNLINNSLSGNILAMTGTSTQYVNKNLIYNSLGLKVLYKISINTAVDIGLLSNYSIKVINIKLDNINKIIKSGNKQKVFYQTEKAHYDYLNKIAQQAIHQKRKDTKFRILARRRAIINSISKDNVTKWLWNNLDGRKLFFCSSINQANSLTNQVYHSKSDNKYLQKFIDGSINEIAMVNAGGTGFTYKEINHLVIVQSDSDKNGLTIQKICRSLLTQKKYKAQIWMLCLNNTQDEIWVNSVLEKLDKTKIEHIKITINEQQF